MNEELFNLWAPEESRWSLWAKPVLFADCRESVPLDKPLEAALPAASAFPLGRDTAAIVDVPGANSVIYGLALAGIGYRPVPLFNSSCGNNTLVDMRTVADYLVYAAANLQKLKLPAEAPPVFLLNADRMDHEGDASVPGRYDNRWCVVPQDMPSAEYLTDAGITRVALISDRVRDDLAHVLCRYQDAGIVILRTSDFRESPVKITVERPADYKSLFYRFQVFAGLRRNAAGGFGGVVPNPNSSGGGFG